MKFLLGNDQGNEINSSHIDVLDGIRALAVLIVVWFHIWQQTWIIPAVQTPALSFLGIDSINLDWLPRTGYMMVTMMIFLSGFCLYLPYARHEGNNGPGPSVKQFYRNRVARIVPSYLFSIIVVLIYDIYNCSYTDSGFIMKDNPSFMTKDILSHLTFTFNLFPDVSGNTLLNGVLWTIALEVQFYILFPLIQKCFEKQPVATYIIMNGISYIYTQFATSDPDGNLGFLLHQLPSYLSVYANGFMGAIIFVNIARRFRRDNYIGIISTITSFGCIYVYRMMMLDLASAENLNIWQIENRYAVSILFLVFVISTSLSLSWYRFIFSNKLMRFLSTISFNLYIWHQFLCTAFKKNRIPYYEGDQYPNEIGDTVWMWKLFLLSFAASFAMAVAATYLIEKPLAKILRGTKKDKMN